MVQSSNDACAKAHGFPIQVRPDWVAEVLSTNRRKDILQKQAVLHRAGVPHYWLIDPGP